MKLKSTFPERVAHIETDFYIPLAVTWGEPISSVIYWQIKHGPANLLEIGMDASTGAYVSLTLITAKRYQKIKSPLSRECSTAIEGIPISKFHNGKTAPFETESKAFDVYVGDSFIQILLDSEQVESKTVESRCVRFAYNDDNDLVSILIYDLSKPQIVEITEALNHIQL